MYCKAFFKSNLLAAGKVAVDTGLMPIVVKADAAGTATS